MADDFQTLFQVHRYQYDSQYNLVHQPQNIRKHRQSTSLEHIVAKYIAKLVFEN